ncbi:TPA: glycosyltransferase family 4 protein, partial [Candidatus Woesearchaeota archaeon]|nr:glycosyltransferase family 4 protein [Candidatus Woesearchaeota archaeon]
KNPQAIAAKILLLADDASLRKKLADAGYRLAQGYDLRKVVSEYEGLYQRIMAKIKS